MSEPFLAEIRIVGFNFAPRGWAFCDGQILPISQNQSLYSLLGTTYGGDGETSFALPDMRGRVPIHVGASNGVNHHSGEKGGYETVALTNAQNPVHTHTLQANSGYANQPIATSALLSTTAATDPIYADSGDSNVDMNMGSVTSVGGQEHINMQPFLTLSFCIALRGLFPSE